MKIEEQKPSNPHAFPNTDGTTFCNDGMTLRDYFAAKSISNTNMADIIQGRETEVAIRAYLLADAMLKQREI